MRAHEEFLVGGLFGFLAFFPTKAIVNIVLFGKSFSKP
jgi:hypothetical protein